MFRPFRRKTTVDVFFLVCSMPAEYQGQLMDYGASGYIEVNLNLGTHRPIWPLRHTHLLFFSFVTLLFFFICHTFFQLSTLIREYFEASALTVLPRGDMWG